MSRVVIGSTFREHGTVLTRVHYSTIALCATALLIAIVSCTSAQDSASGSKSGATASVPTKLPTASPPLPVTQPIISREVWERRIAGLDRIGNMHITVSEFRMRWPPPPHFTGGWDGSEQQDSGEVLRSFDLDDDWGLVARWVYPPDRELPFGVTGVLKTWSIVGLEDFRPQIGEELFEAVRAIHHVSRHEAEPDPVTLYRAVHRLVSMGKEQAIEALRAYLRLCESHKFGGLYGFDDNRIRELADLLFVRRDMNRPLPMTRIPWMWLPRKDSNAWPRFPFAVSGGLPFRVPTGPIPISKGPLGSAGWLLNFCAANADLRTDVLVPEGDPIAAAEEVLFVEAWDEIESVWPNDHPMFQNPQHDPRLRWPQQVREQAARALDNVVPYTELVPPRPLFPAMHRDDEIPFEKRWERYCAMVRERMPRWDLSIEDFVATRPVPPGPEVATR